MKQKTPDYITKLRNSNLRPTKQRLKICEVLFDRPKTFHFTINNLYKLLSNNLEKKISLATVYNTIHAFKKSGYLKQANIDSSHKFTFKKGRHYFWRTHRNLYIISKRFSSFC